MNDLVPFREAVADARRDHRLLITWARNWGLANGQPFDPDLLALVLTAATWCPIERWTRSAVYHVLRCDVNNWCVVNGCREPEGAPETLWGWLHFLDATGGHTGDDEPLSQLIKPFLCYVGFDYQGRQRPEGAPRLIECECFEPMSDEERAVMEQEMRLRRERGD